MSPRLLLRIAAVALVVFALGHTLGGMIFAESHGPEEAELLRALGAYRFDTMGSMRSHLDFYEGGGWFLSAMLVTSVALAWIASNATEESPRLVARFAFVLGAFFATSAALSATYFFAAPLVTSVVASASFFAAALRLRGAAKAASRARSTP